MRKVVLAVMALLAVGCGGGGGGTSSTLPPPAPTNLPAGFVYVTGDGRQDIGFSLENGSGQRTLFGEALTVESSPFVTPDGKRVFFTSSRDGKVSEIYSVLHDGTDLRKHSNVFPSGAFSPSLSPAGTKLAYTKPRASDSQHQLYVADLDGTNEVGLVLRDTQHGDPVWSADGTEIYFVSAPTIAAGVQDGIMAVNVSTGVLRTVYSATQVRREGNLSLSPDGTKLAFVTYIAGFMQVAVCDTSGAGFTQLTSDTFQKDRIAWTKDGLSLRYYNHGLPHSINEISVTGGTPKFIAPYIGAQMLWFAGP